MSEIKNQRNAQTSKRIMLSINLIYQSFFRYKEILKERIKYRYKCKECRWRSLCEYGNGDSIPACAADDFSQGYKFGLWAHRNIIWHSILERPEYDCQILAKVRDGGHDKYILTYFRTDLNELIFGSYGYTWDDIIQWVYLDSIKPTDLF